MAVVTTPTLGTWGIGALPLAIERFNLLDNETIRNVVLLAAQVALDVLGYIPVLGQITGLLRIGAAVTLAFSALQHDRDSKIAMLALAIGQATRGIIEVSGLTQINLLLDIVGTSANATYVLIQI